MPELDPRKQTILRAVVLEYVHFAEPVGSEMLAARYQWGVKSATIRNELAELSDLGLLEQPHTSAGRIPSDLGYRFFVDRLIESEEPTDENRQKMKDAASEGDVLYQLVDETTKVLSRLTHNLSAATVFKNQNLTIRSAVVSALGPKQAITVIVLSNGQVENRMIEVPEELTLTQLGHANEWLAKNLVSKSLKAGSRTKYGDSQPATERLLAAVIGAVKSISKEVNRAALTTQGEEFLFAHPEFKGDSKGLAELLESLKDSDVLLDTIQNPNDQVSEVSIGKEHKHEQLHRLSVIRQRFFVGENEVGVIALIGPTRMPYQSTIPLVNFSARALSDSLTRFLG